MHNLDIVDLKVAVDRTASIFRKYGYVISLDYRVITGEYQVNMTAVCTDVSSLFEQVLKYVHVGYFTDAFVYTMKQFISSKPDKCITSYDPANCIVKLRYILESMDDEHVIRHRDNEMMGDLEFTLHAPEHDSEITANGQQKLIIAVVDIHTSVRDDISIESVTEFKRTLLRELPEPIGTAREARSLIEFVVQQWLYSGYNTKSATTTIRLLRRGMYHNVKSFGAICTGRFMTNVGIGHKRLGTDGEQWFLYGNVSDYAEFCAICHDRFKNAEAFDGAMLRNIKQLKVGDQLCALNILPLEKLRAFLDMFLSEFA